jgi:hypothetical protein
VIEAPERELPIPTIGAPPPVKLVADWLPIPPEELEELLEETVATPLEPGPEVELDPEGELVPELRLKADPELPEPELPIPPDEPNPVEPVPCVPPTVEPDWPGEAMEEADPKPPPPLGRPARG